MQTKYTHQISYWKLNVVLDIMVPVVFRTTEDAVKRHLENINKMNGVEDLKVEEINSWRSYDVPFEGGPDQYPFGVESNTNVHIKSYHGMFQSGYAHEFDWRFVMEWKFA